MPHRSLLGTLARDAAVLLPALVCSPCYAGPAIVPDFAAGDFDPGAPINNRYYPLVPGTVFRYSADVRDPSTQETEHQELEDFVTFKTETAARVNVRVVRSRAWTDGLLVEETSDLFAQDRAGNVWYMGEDTTAFTYDDEGILVSESKGGSWRAGVNGAKPGFIMPANPVPGFAYYQEFAPADRAVDQAEIASLDQILSTQFGTFNNVLKVRETTALEPGIFENKYYAPGIGQVLIEEDIDASGVAHAIIPLRSVTAVPLPLAIWPMSAMFVGVVTMVEVRRRRSTPR